jgi:hypothetical protein
MNNELKNTTTSVMKLIEDNEKISLQLFANKLSKASETYPEDHTIGLMAGVVSRMAGSKLFISRAEVKELYKHLQSRNTKFATLFANELGEIEKLPESKKYNREHDDESGNIINAAYEKIVDPVLANALHNAFGNKNTAYSETFATKAKDLCTRGLSEFAATIEVASGNEDVIVCRASFETPKGKTSVFVPVEIVSGKIIAPSVFVGNAGPEDLTRDNIKNYIVANVGKNLTISDSLVLAAVDNIKHGELSKISNVDLALTKLNATKEKSADFSQGQVLYQKVDQEAKNIEVETPKFATDTDLSGRFDTASGIAAFKFGNKVKLGRDIISKHLKAFDLTNHQISVFDSNDNTIFYAVSLNSGKVAFRVPVRVQDGKLLAPTMLLANGSAEAFSKDGICKISIPDTRTAALASPLFIKKASELVEIVRVAMDEQNYATAEEALTVLSAADDARAYHVAFECYKNGLSGVKTIATKCSNIIKSATSTHDLCGHTGLPLHKVYQDKNNHCLPKYRQGMAESYDGASFMNSKVYL